MILRRPSAKRPPRWLHLLDDPSGVEKPRRGGKGRGGTRALRIELLEERIAPVVFLAVSGEPPASVTAGSGFGISVAVDDGIGEVDTSFNDTIALALANNPGGTTLGGTLTETAVNGVAAFTGLTLNTAAAGYTLSAVTPNENLTAVTTSAITVTPAAVAMLAITTEPPANVQVHAPFGMAAAAEDSFGNIVTTYTTPMTASASSAAPSAAPRRSRPRAAWLCSRA